MVSAPGARCPTCALPLGDWPGDRAVHQCPRCQRPLARLPASLGARVLSWFDLARALTAAVGAAWLASLLLTGAPIRALAAAVAVQLALFGSTDATDGIVAVQTGIDRTARTLRFGKPARTRGWLKAAFGGVTCLVGAAGFILLRGGG